LANARNLLEGYKYVSHEVHTLLSKIFDSKIDIHLLYRKLKELKAELKVKF